MKQKIFFGLVLYAHLISTVPLIVISPTNVNQATGYTISSGGSYLLSDDVAATSVSAVNSAINITASHVVLDLNGKTIRSSPGSGIAINSAGNITIKNGKLFNCQDSGITGTNLSNVTIENVISSSHNGTGINLTSGGQSVIRNCTAQSNNAYGMYVDLNDTVIENCISENNTFDGLYFTTQNVRVSRGQYNRNAGSGISAFGTQGVLEQLSANQNSGNAGIVLSGLMYVNQCLAQNNTGTGIVVSGVGMVKECVASFNGVEGFSSTNQGTLLGNIAFSNTLNYAATGPLAYIQINNGGQTMPGLVIDPKYDNVSIVRNA